MGKKVKKMQFQQTLTRNYTFEGKGLHTGRTAKMTVCPAPVNTGVVFRRVDLGENACVEALAENVSNTARSTTISKGEASVSTIEHIMSALTGMGVDNAMIEIDNIEVPILDGSAKPYIDAIWKDGLEEQDAPRKYIEIKETIELTNEKGSIVRIEPAEEFSYDILVDFNSRVLGVQHGTWTADVDYTKEMEESLDKIAEGKTPWLDFMEIFYKNIQDIIGYTAHPNYNQKNYSPYFTTIGKLTDTRV